MASHVLLVSDSRASPPVSRENFTRRISCWSMNPERLDQSRRNRLFPSQTKNWQTLQNSSSAFRKFFLIGYKADVSRWVFSEPVKSIALRTSIRPLSVITDRRRFGCPEQGAHP